MGDRIAYDPNKEKKVFLKPKLERNKIAFLCFFKFISLKPVHIFVCVYSTLVDVVQLTYLLRP